MAKVGRREMVTAASQLLKISLEPALTWRCRTLGAQFLITGEFLTRSMEPSSSLTSICWRALRELVRSP